MADNQYYDIKPKSWDWAVLFNDLINVRPVPAPRTWMWTRKDNIVEHSDNGYFFLRKRKWTHHIQTFYKESKDSCDDLTNDTYLSDWREWEFTDSVIFEWNRYFIRTNNYQSKIRIYKQINTNTDIYWKQCLSSIEDWQIVCLWLEYDTTPITYKRFLKTQTVWWHTKKISSDKATLWITTNIKWERDEDTWEQTKVSKINYVLDIQTDWEDYPIMNYVYFNDKWFSAIISDPVCESVFNLIWLQKKEWHSYYFLESTEFLNNFSLLKTWRCENILMNSETDDIFRFNVNITLADKYWDSLTFVASDWLHTILMPNREYQSSVWDIECEYVDLSDYNQFSWEIISATMWNNRIAVLTETWWLAIWWPWMAQFSFPVDSTSDTVVWFYNVWNKFTTLMPVFYTLVLAWPHETAYFMPENNTSTNETQWLYTMTDKVWVFSETSYCWKDWKLFIWRSWWEVYYLEMSPNSYWYQQWVWNFYSADWYTRLKDLRQWHQKMNIDMTDNDCFVSIYEEDNKYWSMVLCEDRHYNIRYVRLFDSIKVTRVLEWWNILLWNCIYSMDEKYLYDIEAKNSSWSRNDEHVIKEVINIIFWDETPTANKHFMFYKMAIWDNSRISNDTWIRTDVVSSWRLWDRTVNITNTRYAALLTSKESDWAIRQWDFWYQILWHWKRTLSWFEEEIDNYNKLEKLIEPNARIGYTTSSKLWLYSVIKEPIWQEWELLQLTFTSCWVDDLELWSIFIWWFPRDYDFADIEDVNVDSTEFTSDSESEWHIQKEFNTRG